MDKSQIFPFIINQAIQNCIEKIPSWGRVLSKPSYVNLWITSLCNLKCKQCYIWKNKKKYLETEKIKKIIKDLRKWLGPFHLSFSGGEPLLRKDMPELIKLSSRLGIMTNLITNGTLLNKEMADQLSESKLDLLTISLDGINEITHDYIRGVKGTYKKVIKNINYSKEKLQIKIATLLLDNNLKEAPSLIEWSKKNNLFGIEFQAFQPPFGNKRYNPSWYKTNEFWPRNNQKINYIFDSLLEMKKEGYPILNTAPHLKFIKEYYKNPTQKFSKITCGANTKNLKISEKGELILCRFQPSLGYLTNINIQSIWESKETLKIRNSIKKCKKTCSLINCNFDKGLIAKTYQFFRLYK